MVRAASLMFGTSLNNCRNNCFSKVMYKKEHLPAHVGFPHLGHVVLKHILTAAICLTEIPGNLVSRSLSSPACRSNVSQRRVVAINTTFIEPHRGRVNGLAFTRSVT